MGINLLLRICLRIIVHLHCKYWCAFSIALIPNSTLAFGSVVWLYDWHWGVALVPICVQRLNIVLVHENLASPLYSSVFMWFSICVSRCCAGQALLLCEIITVFCCVINLWFCTKLWSVSLVTCIIIVVDHAWFLALKRCANESKRISFCIVL